MPVARLDVTSFAIHEEGADDVQGFNMILLALFAAQAGDVGEPKRQLDPALVGAEQVMTQSFKCMDSSIKTELRAHLADATPQTVVDAALTSCAYLKEDLVKAVSGPGTYILPARGQELAEEWFGSLRATYVKHVDESLAKPEMAKARFEFTILTWRKCVTEKATAWSRLTDEASTVGKAAVTSCSDHRAHVQTALRYQLRSSKLPETRAAQILDRVDNTLEEVAVATVISERAKRLPKQ